MSESDVLLFEPNTTTARPAYAVWVDKAHKRVVFGFRGTTDLNVGPRRGLRVHTTGRAALCRPHKL